MEESRTAIAEIRRDVNNLNSDLRQSANAADNEKRSCSILTALDSRGLFILTERQQLKKWLSPLDPSINHNNARRAHHEGTANWFFRSSNFDEWKSSPSLLWIHGKRTFLFLFTTHTTDSHRCSGLRQKHPVVRYSCYCCLYLLTLSPSSGIIETIRAQRDAESAIMAYFYCDFRNKEKQSCRNLVLSIIWQLCTQSDLCYDTLSRVYSARDEGAPKPSDETLTKCLMEVVSLPVQGPIYLILDALDECPNNSGMPTPREEVLNLIKDLVSLRLPHLHMCITSRPEIDIQAILEPLTSLRMSLHDQTGQKEDILDYVRSFVSSDTKMQKWREEDRNLVIETLSKRAGGM